MPLLCLGSKCCIHVRVSHWEGGNMWDHGDECCDHITISKAWLLPFKVATVSCPVGGFEVYHCARQPESGLPIMWESSQCLVVRSVTLPAQTLCFPLQQTATNTCCVQDGKITNTTKSRRGERTSVRAISWGDWEHHQRPPWARHQAANQISGASTCSRCCHLWIAGQWQRPMVAFRVHLLWCHACIHGCV